jgi:hypothetical protein
VVGEAIEAEGAVVFAHAAGWTWRGSSKRAGNRYWSGRSRLGLKSKNPAFCADEPKGAKAQKIGLEEQARPLVRPHIDGASLRITCGRVRAVCNARRVRLPRKSDTRLSRPFSPHSPGKERAEDARTDFAHQ